MTEPFEDRLREATVEPHSVDFSALRSAASKASTQMTSARALALIRLAHNQMDESEPGATEFVRRINGHDHLVDEHGQDQLVALLAVEALIALLSRNVQAIGVFAASAVRCADHAGWKPAHPDLTAVARHFLEQRAVSVRERVPIDSPLAKAKPKSPIGTAQHAEEELQTLREIVKGDRARVWERDELTWWLLSETRSAGVFGIAQSFNYAISFLPEPLTTDEMLTFKLGKKPSDISIPGAEAVPSDLSDFCPCLGQLVGGSAEDEAIPEQLSQEDRDLWVQRIRNVLDELLLIRAWRSANS